jgi:alpha-1,3/alpha-1,6-mannosyltransferase
MQARVPVLAANTGGPLETIVDGETGWLRDVSDVSDVQAWTDVMATALDSRNEELLGEMGRKGRERVGSEFSERRMAETLDGVVEGLVRQESRGSDTQFADALLVVGVAGMVLVGAVYVATGVVAVRYGV